MNPWFRAVFLAALFCGISALLGYGSNPATRDFISYWSAGHLLRAHQNPYDAQAVMTLERTQGYTDQKPMIVRNPPWMLFLTLPLGWMSSRSGLVLWTLVAFGSVELFLRLFSIAQQDRVLAYLFAPVLACLKVGQSSPFMLIGIALFLRFYRTRPMAAGAGLLLIAIKPHLFLIFWPVLVADCLYRKRYLLFAGGLAAGAASTLAAMAFNPHIWADYFSFLFSARIAGEFIPNPAVLLRLWVNPNWPWLQMLPSCAALIWAAWFYVRRRRAWDWRTHGMLMLLVSLLVSAYSWTTDEIALLPAMMVVVSNRNRRKHATVAYMLVSGAALLMLVFQVPLTSGAYIWTTAAWLGLYLYATAGTPPRDPFCEEAQFDADSVTLSAD